MIIGVLREVKDNENRVAVTCDGVGKLTSAGHLVLIETMAGAGSGISNEQFEDAGAEIAGNRNELCDRAGLVLKIKEPVPEEYNIFKPGQMLFTFFHFASSRQLTEAMLNAKLTCVAYETVETLDGNLPLLSPMSEVAGKAASIIAANYLSRSAGGKGVLASSVAGVKPARFVVAGGGNVGQAAAAVALGMGAEVLILERTEEKISKLTGIFPQASVVLSTQENVQKHVKGADVVIGAAYIPGARAPQIVSRKMVKQMEEGSVIVDAAIDQGGCIETSRPTTHSNPVYVEEGVIHYCVTNMPGAFPRTSTCALAGATLPYVLELAARGMKAFEKEDMRKGLNICNGKITNRGVAEAHKMPYSDPIELLG